MPPLPRGDHDGDPDAPPVQSPWIWEAPDYQGKIIRITVEFDNTTRDLTGATVYRDADCVYTSIFLGLGSDGRPNSSGDSFPVPAGTTRVPTQILRRNRLRTIEDVLAVQITAGA